MYLQETLPFYRRAPRWLTRWADARWLLRLAARRSGSTRAHGMGRMTLSMLQGAAGHHAAELERLAAWLGSEGRPDIIQISTVLLIGLARPLREKLGAPVVCMAQDEDVWLDRLDRPYDERCWATIREKAADVDTFVAASEYYAAFFAGRTGVARDRLCVVYPGIDPEGYEMGDASPCPPTIGYLSKMTESLGLGTLVDAFVMLKRKPGFRDARLRAMGGATGRDPRFLAGLRKKLSQQGMGDAVEFLPEMDRASRLAFLRSLAVLCVPAPGGVAFGTFLLEAMASGVPVVQPNCGAFPELIEATRGGVVYEPHTAAGLARALEGMLSDRRAAGELGRRGRQAVLERFTVEQTAAKMIDVYRL
jgi:glycosyltransferase involved in cell wall biosynthesis